MGAQSRPTRVDTTVSTSRPCLRKVDSSFCARMCSRAFPPKWASPDVEMETCLRCRHWASPQRRSTVSRCRTDGIHRTTCLCLQSSRCLSCLHQAHERFCTLLLYVGVWSFASHSQ